MLITLFDVVPHCNVEVRIRVRELCESSGIDYEVQVRV